MTPVVRRIYVPWGKTRVVEAFDCKGNAHLDFGKAVAGLPVGLRGARPPAVPQTPWPLIEHMRIAQWDILEFSRDPAHQLPEFPQGYWPAEDAPPR